MTMNIAQVGLAKAQPMVRPQRSPAVQNSSDDMADLSVDQIDRSVTTATPPAVAFTTQGISQTLNATLNQLVAAPSLDPLTRATLWNDLSQFPEPWINFMTQSGLRIAAFSENQTLADSPAMSKFSVPNLEEQLVDTKAKLSQAFSQIERPSDEYSKKLLQNQLSDNLQNYLMNSNSPFRLGIISGDFTLEQICEHRHVPANHREVWSEKLQELNQNWIQGDNNTFNADFGVILLPPVLTDAGYLPDAVFQSARETKADDIAAKLGENRGVDRMVLLHEKYLAADAPEVGGYRVAIHETGHALDYILEGLPEETGFGKQHVTKVHEMFEHATQKNAFTSDYASSNVREYFAEGVEAYLTPPGTDQFRPDNHADQLRKVDPDLYSYLKKTLDTEPNPDWQSRTPLPQQLPPGTPDPDKDPIYFD